MKNMTKLRVYDSSTPKRLPQGSRHCANGSLVKQEIENEQHGMSGAGDVLRAAAPEIWEDIYWRDNNDSRRITTTFCLNFFHEWLMLSMKENPKVA
ncbi:hypothetical protein [Paenibacillus mendelii]|uniref:Uncharacterized protein n=1 Tax=Paenibacillus mendelii TaxID=206163 RepID=A0ABV6JE53_9BACL|nr:hypothetical protein [Paenibacillus mendelii]MCQ6563371.1 hypothetical protein [Paenibacillus mendelii]